MKGLRALFGRKGKAAVGGILGVVLVNTLKLDPALAEQIIMALYIFVGGYIGTTAYEDAAEKRSRGVK